MIGNFTKPYGSSAPAGKPSTYVFHAQKANVRSPACYIGMTIWIANGANKSTIYTSSYPKCFLIVTYVPYHNMIFISIPYTLQLYVDWNLDLTYIYVVFRNEYSSTAWVSFVLFFDNCHPVRKFMNPKTDMAPWFFHPHVSNHVKPIPSRLRKEEKCWATLAICGLRKIFVSCQLGVALKITESSWVRTEGV